MLPRLLCEGDPAGGPFAAATRLGFTGFFFPLLHRLVLRMSLDESYPGIQPTTARKAGDLLTFTH
jgi:hypothetical protein